MMPAKAKDVDSYLIHFPVEMRAMMEELRGIIINAAPKAEETISYAMPAYKQDGMLVYFAGWPKHIGFYPGASGISHFTEQLSGYNLSKGTVQFPLGKKLPAALITKIVKFRLKENADKAKLKKAGKK